MYFQGYLITRARPKSRNAFTMLMLCEPLPNVFDFLYYLTYEKILKQKNLFIKGLLEINCMVVNLYQIFC